MTVTLDSIANLARSLSSVGRGNLLHCQIRKVCGYVWEAVLKSPVDVEGPRPLWAGCPRLYKKVDEQATEGKSAISVPSLRFMFLPMSLVDGLQHIGQNKSFLSQAVLAHVVNSSQQTSKLKQSVPVISLQLHKT